MLHFLYISQVINVTQFYENKNYNFNSKFSLNLYFFFILCQKTKKRNKKILNKLCLFRFCLYLPFSFFKFFVCVSSSHFVLLTLYISFYLYKSIYIKHIEINWVKARILHESSYRRIVIRIFNLIEHQITPMRIIEWVLKITAFAVSYTIRIVCAKSSECVVFVFVMWKWIVPNVLGCDIDDLSICYFFFSFFLFPLHCVLLLYIQFYWRHVCTRIDDQSN